MDIDPSGQQIVLSDGTFVHVAPTTRVRVGHTVVPIGQLRSGDEIIIQVRQPAAGTVPATVVTTTPVPAAADRYAGSALPYQSYADTRIEAADVIVMWSPQAR